MNLEVCELFCRIAEQGNMGRAAEMLHMSPSAASHAISALERELGFELLSRDRTGCRLTPHGRLLLPGFQALQAEAVHLQEEIDRLNGLEKGFVRIGAFDSICGNWIPQIFRTFHARYPNIEVHIYQDGYAAIESMLTEGSIDIGFLSNPSSDQLALLPLLRDRLLCIMPLHFTPKHPDFIVPEDFAGQTLLLSERGYDSTVMNYLHENGLSASPQNRIMLDTSVIALVESGMGLSILPEFVLQKYPGNYRALPLHSHICRTIHLCTLKNKRPTLACRKMIEVIREVITSAPEDGGRLPAARG